jgi:hypothetical protein
MPDRGRARWFVFGLGAAGAVVALAACGGGGEGAKPQIPEVPITAVDYKYESIPSSIPGGLT